MIDIPNPEKAWHQRDNESDVAYAAFCMYLNLPKRGDPERGGVRRYQADLERARGVQHGQVGKWLRAHEWESRAEAWDAVTFSNIDKIVELEHRRRLADELRKTGEKIRKKATQILEAMEDDSFKPMDAINLLKAGIAFEKDAQKLEDPDVEKKREQIKVDIQLLVDKLGIAVAPRVGGLASRTAGRTLALAPREGQGDETEGIADGRILEIPEES